VHACLPAKPGKLRPRPRRGRSPERSEGSVVAGATSEQMDRIVDAFIDAVEKEGLYCGGSFHPVGRCDDCREEAEAG